jgi:hypothetical protein
VHRLISYKPAMCWGMQFRRLWYDFCQQLRSNASSNLLSLTSMCKQTVAHAEIVVLVLIQTAAAHEYVVIICQVAETTAPFFVNESKMKICVKYMIPLSILHKDSNDILISRELY